MSPCHINLEKYEGAAPPTHPPAPEGDASLREETTPYPQRQQEI